MLGAAAAGVAALAYAYRSLARTAVADTRVRDPPAAPASLPASPVTEMANELTARLSSSTGEEGARLLREASAQVFGGYRGMAGLQDEEAVRDLDLVVTARAAELLRGGARGRIVVGGCGTSGRVAFLVAREMNAVLGRLGAPPAFSYLVSGGDPALLLSDELPEDDARRGAEELDEALGGGAGRALYVGVTCGLSAPYVGGQLDCAMDREGCAAALVGFNPVALARDAPVEGWGGRTFRRVAERLDALRGDGQHGVVNPAVGPEAVTGSSRMKGGTATKLLLEAAFARAVALAFPARVAPLPDAAGVFARYEDAWRRTFSGCRQLGAAADLASRALRAGRRIFYLGAGAPGVVAFIDSSEMPDTYGTPHERVRAHLDGGWAAMGNAAGDLTAQNPLFRVSLDHFRSDADPGEGDLVAVVCAGDDRPARLFELAAWARGRGASTALLEVAREGAGGAGAGGDSFDAAVRAELPELGLLRVDGRAPADACLATSATKWMCNVLTTLANAHAGMVCGNEMVNLTVANAKLFHRSVAIVARLSGAGEEAARRALMRSIYADDGERWDGAAELSRHIVRATAGERVVPVAILLARGAAATAADARRAIEAGGSVEGVVGGGAV